MRAAAKQAWSEALAAVDVDGTPDQRTGFYTAPGDIGAESTAETAEILAYDLTTCDGQTAYRHVVWWFPDQGQTYESVMAQRGGDDGYDLCDA